MNRSVKISKNGDFTKVEITINGKTDYFASDKGRSLVVIPGGVKILPDPEEKILNNFKILISELVDNYGATTGQELLDEILTRNFFKKGGGGVSETVEVVDDLTSTDVDKALSANQGKVLKDNQDLNKQSIDEAEQEIQNNASSISDLENQKLDAGQYQGTADDFSVRANDEIIDGLKSFLYDKLGFRNFANTFTSYFRNSNTASRYYTFQNRNGTIADDTDLATKQDKFSGILNRVPKSIGEFVLGVSRLFDDGRFFGIDTTYSPSKDITLKNGETRVIGIEESDANTNGQDLRVEAGRTNDYRTNEGFSLFATTGSSIKSMAISPTTNDYYILDTSGNLYKQTNGQGSYVATGDTFANPFNLHISHLNDLYVSSGAGLNKQTNCQGAFSNIEIYYGRGALVRADNNRLYGLSSTGIYLADDENATNPTDLGINVSPYRSVDLAYHQNGSVYFVTTNAIYKQNTINDGFINLNQEETTYTGITVGLNGNVYACSNNAIYEQVGGIGGFVKRDDTVRSYSDICTNPTTGNIYVIAGSEIFELSFSQKGTPNLDGGTLKSVAGTGKGAGQSRYQIITGQKQPSGTDMQPEVVRFEVDEEGRMYYTEDKSSIYTDRTIVDKNYSDSLKYVEVSASRNLLASDNGKSLVVTATGVLLTIPATGLQNDFNCVITTTTGNDATINVGSVTADENGLILNSKDTKSIGRLGLTYIIR